MQKTFIFLPFHIRGKCVASENRYPYVAESYVSVRLSLRMSVAWRLWAVVAVARGVWGYAVRWRSVSPPPPPHAAQVRTPLVLARYLQLHRPGAAVLHIVCGSCPAYAHRDAVPL